MILRPKPHFRRRPASAPLLIAALLATLPAPAVAGAEWIPARGAAAVQGSRETALYRAERQALSRALARYLQTWLSEQQIEAEAKTMNDWFFAAPRAYVDAVSSASTSQAGIQAIWQGLVKFNEDRVVGKLQELGLISSWDRDPRIALRLDGIAPDEVTRYAWYKDFAAAGIDLIEPGTSSQTHGVLTARSVTRSERHPLVPERLRPVTDIVLSGVVSGRELTLNIAAGPDDRAGLVKLTTALAIQSLFSAWIPGYLDARNQRLWEAGEFGFVDFQAWMAFDRALMDHRALFHDVYPHLVRRDDDGWRVTYRFLLNPDDIEAAVGWLKQRRFNVVRAEGRQAFVTQAP